MRENKYLLFQVAKPVVIFYKQPVLVLQHLIEFSLI